MTFSTMASRSGAEGGKPGGKGGCGKGGGGEGRGGGGSVTGNREGRSQASPMRNKRVLTESSSSQYLPAPVHSTSGTPVRTWTCTTVVSCSPPGRVSDETEPPTESTMAAILGISAIPLGLLAGGDWGPVMRTAEADPAAPGALPCDGTWNG